MRGPLSPCPPELLGPVRALVALSGLVATPREIRARVRAAGWDRVRVAPWSPEPIDRPPSGTVNVTVRRADEDGPMGDDEPVKVVYAWVEQ